MPGVIEEGMELEGVGVSGEVVPSGAEVLSSGVEVDVGVVVTDWSDREDGSGGEGDPAEETNEL